MSRKELDKLDDMIGDEHGAIFLGDYEDMDGNTIRVYEGNGQRYLMEIDGGKWTIYTHHESGGTS